MATPAAALDAAMARNILQKLFLFVAVPQRPGVKLIVPEFSSLEGNRIVASVSEAGIFGDIALDLYGRTQPEVMRGKWRIQCDVAGLGKVTRQGWIGDSYEGFSCEDPNGCLGPIMVGRISSIADQQVMGSRAMDIGRLIAVEARTTPA